MRGRLYVGQTDWDWFNFLRNRPDIDELNFWQPGGTRHFAAIEPGELFLFKLKAPYQAIAGGGVFVYSTLLPISQAWYAFEHKNGASGFEQLRRQTARHRRISPEVTEDFTIGCVILQDPFFLTPDEWIPVPDDFSRYVQVGKSYDLESLTGQHLLNSVTTRLANRTPSIVADAARSAVDLPMFGEPVLVRRRLRQGAFRVLITDTYQRRCAVSGERTLPVLQASHIKPVSQGGLHSLDNGLLLRADIHALFDLGYATVTPDLSFRVSRRVRTEYHNGRIYYDLDGSVLNLPRTLQDQPNREFLEWHNDTVFKS